MEETLVSRRATVKSELESKVKEVDELQRSVRDIDGSHEIVTGRDRGCIHVFRRVTPCGMRQKWEAQNVNHGVYVVRVIDVPLESS